MNFQSAKAIAVLYGIPIEKISYANTRAFLHACNQYLTGKALKAFHRATEQASSPGGRKLYRRKRKQNQDLAKWTTSGKKRKGKVIITPERLKVRALYWQPIRLRLREVILSQGQGAQASAAKFIGTSSSHIHRWICPVCEHDLEPTYSLGKKIEEYLQLHEYPTIQI